MKSEVSIGVLNLDVEPERLSPQEDSPGYLRCDGTFDFRVKKEIVREATIERVVAGEPELIPNFVEAAKKLEARGVQGIVGDCGFIAAYQPEITKAVSVPVISSSLILVPLVYRTLTANKKVGILTANSEILSEKHFNAVGWSSKDIPVAIKGINELQNVNPEFNKREKDVVRLARELVKDNPDIGAFVIECTVFQPYSHAIREATGLPVFDITTAARLLHDAADPPNYEERQ